VQSALYTSLYILCCAVAVELRLTATVGDRLVLPCVSRVKGTSHSSPCKHSVKEVDWRYRQTIDAVEKFVWNKKWLVNGYKSCCAIETVAAGTYNLVIHEVTLNHTGFYDCVERGGFGKRRRVRLDVLPSPATEVTTPRTGRFCNSLVNTAAAEINNSNIL